MKELLDNFDVITIRESVKNFLLDNFKKESTFLPHPFFEYKKDSSGNKCNYYSLCISRIDFDKNINMILNANKLLEDEKKIYLFGAENRLYIHHKLKNMDFEKYWMGKYPKNLPMKYENKDILDNCAFVVDMSIINGDGGGTQYTFLEAIYHSCALILHKDWVEKGDLFKNGINCFVVGYTDNIGEEINQIISKGINTEYKSIIKTASKLLKTHTKELWKDIFP